MSPGDDSLAIISLDTATRDMRSAVNRLREAVVQLPPSGQAAISADVDTIESILAEAIRRTGRQRRKLTSTPTTEGKSVREILFREILAEAYEAAVRGTLKLTAALTIADKPEAVPDGAVDKSREALARFADARTTLAAIASNYFPSN